MIYNYKLLIIDFAIYFISSILYNMLCVMS